MNKLILLLFLTTIVGCKQKTKESAQPETDSKMETQIESEPEWISLFDGKTLNGWHLYNNPEGISAWVIEDGVLEFPGRKSGSLPEYNLVTDKEYTNFKLSLEWKISEGGNSGIMWGVIEDKKYAHPYETGPEIQVLDNERHPDALANPKYHQAGALYDMVQPMHDVCKPAGEWNLCEITVNHETNQGSVILNETEIATFPVHGEAWEAMIANSKFKQWKDFGMGKTGKICLQDHENKVWYRNIKIKNI